MGWFERVRGSKHLYRRIDSIDFYKPIDSYTFPYPTPIAVNTTFLIHLHNPFSSHPPIIQSEQISGLKMYVLEISHSPVGRGNNLPSGCARMYETALSTIQTISISPIISHFQHQHTTVNSICLLIRNLNAEFLNPKSTHNPPIPN